MIIKLFGRVFGVARYLNTKKIVYYLHSKIVTLGKSGHTQRIYWFSRKIDEEYIQTSFPIHTVIGENPRSRMPYLKMLTGYYLN